MLEVAGGQIHIAMKGRGIKAIHKEWDKILDQMANGPKVKGIGISHVKADKEVARLKGKLNELFPGNQGCVIGRFVDLRGAYSSGFIDGLVKKRKRMMSPWSCKS